MLPETKDGRDSFMRIREYRSRWRKDTLDFHHGDMDLLKARALQSLALSSDLAELREQVEFMRSEDMLTPQQLEAAENCFGWAKTLLATVPEGAR